MFSQTILILDDDIDLADNISDMLKFSGYNTIVCYNSSDALKEIEGKNIRLIISDIRLKEGVDGPDFVNEARKIRSDIYVIFVTAYSELDNAIKSINAGAFGYLKKPLENEVLLDNVRKALLLIEAEEKIKKHQRELERLVEERTRQLTKSYETLSTVMDNVPVGIWKVSNNGSIEFINKKFSTIIGDCEDFKNISDFKKYVSGDIEFLNSILSGNDGDIEIKMNGERWIAMKYRAIKHGGDFIGSIGIVNDITKKKVAIAELIKLKEGK